MKSGASTDPFDEEEPDTEAEDEESSVEQHADEEPVADDNVERPSEESSENRSMNRQTEQASQQELPYIVRRKLQNKPIHHERERIPFFLRESVLNGEKDLRRSVEDALGDDVHKADLREASYIVAQRHVNKVVAELREMGYDWEG